MRASVGDWCWHVHHGDGLLLERLTEPYETRQKYIRENKPPQEVETRLRLFQPVRGKVTPPLYWWEANAKWEEAYAKWQEAHTKWQEAHTKWQEAHAKWQEAHAKWQEANAKWEEAHAKWQEAHTKWREAYAKWQADPSWKAVEALHAAECPGCPWNGETIFPPADKEGTA